MNLPNGRSFVNIPAAQFKIFVLHIYVHETGGHWVPGGESCRTASGPEGSSAKANLSGAQDYLVTIGSMHTNKRIQSVLAENCTRKLINVLKKPGD